jgi:hypothetical protein
MKKKITWLFLSVMVLSAVPASQASIVKRSVGSFDGSAPVPDPPPWSFDGSAPVPDPPPFPLSST